MVTAVLSLSLREIAVDRTSPCKTIITSIRTTALLPIMILSNTLSKTLALFLIPTETCIHT